MHILRVKLTTALEIMRKFSPHVMFADLEWLIQGAIHFESEPHRTISSETIGVDIITHLKKIKLDCKLGFPCAGVLVDRLLAELQQTERPSHAVARTLREIARRAQDECEGQRFFSVPADKVTYLEVDAIARAVLTNFPDAAFDIEEAGKCLALDRATASVFHLSRHGGLPQGTFESPRHPVRSELGILSTTNSV